MWYERAPSLEDSDGGKILLVGLIMIVSGLILGALEFFEGIPLIGVLIIVIFCGGGWVLFVAGAIIVTIDRFKKSRLFRKKVNFASDFTADLMLF
jgi:NADH:ubiquinone oxidoreductase subunit 6 (subunit J)